MDFFNIPVLIDSVLVAPCVLDQGYCREHRWKIAAYFVNVLYSLRVRWRKVVVFIPDGQGKLSEMQQDEFMYLI